MKNKPNDIGDLLVILTDKSRKELNDLRKNYSINLRKLDFLRWKEMDNLKSILNEVGTKIEEEGSPYELTYLNEKSEFLTSSFDEMGNALKKVVDDNNYNISEDVRKQNWLLKLAFTEGHKMFYNEVNFRYNNFKNEYPEDFIIYKKRLQKKKEDF
jgi:hypothetical protein